MNQIDIRADLNLFRVLEAIATHGGTSGAARALRLTQPAISHALTRLRTMFGDPLFVRQGNGMVPTARARDVLEPVRAHLAGLYETLVLAPEFTPARLVLDFRVGFRDISEAVAFPALMQRLAREAPGVRMLSRRVPREHFERELSAGTLDLGVDRKIRVGPQIQSSVVTHEAHAVVMRAEHPLRTRKLTRAHYVQARHVVVTHLDGPEPIDHLLAERGQSRDIVLRCQHFFAACKVVASSDWLLTMPRSYANELAEVLPIAVLPLPLALPEIELTMYWHQARSNDQAHAWLRDCIFAALLPLSSAPKRE